MIEKILILTLILLAIVYRFVSCSDFKGYRFYTCWWNQHRWICVDGKSFSSLKQIGCIPNWFYVFNKWYGMIE
jgi:thiamine pyrophosphokinase